MVFRRNLLIALLVAWVAACGSGSDKNSQPSPRPKPTTSTSLPATTTSGATMDDAYEVRGTVTAGPVRGVQVQGQPNTAPVTTGFVVARDSKGSVVGRAAISATGTYELRLPPGRYELVPTDTGIMRCPPGQVDVTTEAEVRNLECDTGIR